MGQNQRWYDHKEWTAEPGYYRVLLQVRGSNRKNWSEQFADLRTLFVDAWQPASITVAATALLVHLTETGNNLRKDVSCRCAESLPDDSHAVLTVDHGRVYVDGYLDDYRRDRLWLAAAQKC